MCCIILQCCFVDVFVFVDDVSLSFIHVAIDRISFQSVSIIQSFGFGLGKKKSNRNGKKLKFCTETGFICRENKKKMYLITLIQTL